MFQSLVEEVRFVVEGNRRPGRKTRSDRRQEKLGKRYAGLMKSTGDELGSDGHEMAFGRAIARDAAVSKKSGRVALKGGEVARFRLRRDKQESVFGEAVSPGKKKARHRAIGRELHRGDRPIQDHGSSMHDGRSWSAKRDNPSASDFEKHGRDARSKLGRDRKGGITTVAQRVGGEDDLARRAKAGGIKKQTSGNQWITDKGQRDLMKDSIRRERMMRKQSSKQQESLFSEGSGSRSKKADRQQASREKRWGKSDLSTFDQISTGHTRAMSRAKDSAARRHAGSTGYYRDWVSGDREKQRSGSKDSTSGNRSAQLKQKYIDKNKPKPKPVPSRWRPDPDDEDHAIEKHRMRKSGW